MTELNNSETELQIGQIVYMVINNAVKDVRIDEIYTDYCVVAAQDRDYVRYKKDLYLTKEAAKKLLGE